MNAGLSRLLLALLLFAPLVGCGGEDVTSYTAPSDADPGTGPVRVLAAIVPVGQPVVEDTWFIKLTGKNAGVEEAEPTFRQLLASFEFPQKAGEPSLKWTQPDGWDEDRTKPNRFATLTSKGKPDITITKLGEAAAMVKPNVDRWRRLDLGLIPISPRALEKVVTEKDIRGHKITIVDMRGPGGKGMTPAPADHPPMRGENRPRGKAPLTYKVPEGWKEAPNASMIAVATLQVSEGNETARLLVSPLSKGLPGGLPANVNRWRGDVGLPGLSAAEVERLKFPTIRVAGIEAPMIDLEGKDKRSLVVWFDRGETMWFFKFIGPTKLVGSQKAKFEEFMKSVQFPGGAE